MIKRKPYGDTLEEQLRASKRDQLHQFLLDYGAVRGAVVHATRIVNEMRANHELGPLETLVLGQGYVAAALMSVNLKAPGRLVLNVQCNGPVGGLTVEVNAFGEVRGYLKQVPIEVDPSTGIPGLHELFGTGSLSVTRHLGADSRPFTGIVEMRYGSLAEDLAYYFATSEQTPSALNVSVAFDDAGECIGAGGVFLQALPGADPERVAQIEQILSSLPSIGSSFAAGQTPRRLLETAFAEHAPVMIARRRVAFMCHCSAQRFRTHLRALPVAELHDMLENGPLPVETTCLNCNTTYEFDRADIERLVTDRAE